MKADHTKDMDALDRLVDRELQALLGRFPPRPPKSGRRKTPAPHRQMDDPDPAPDPPRDNVVRAHPLARRPETRGDAPLDDLFAIDERAFLTNAADWLRGRPNADILLDALTRRVLADSAEDDTIDTFALPDAGATDLSLPDSDAAPGEDWDDPDTFDMAREPEGEQPPDDAWDAVDFEVPEDPPEDDGAADDQGTRP
ncbi:hypothetical protein [Maliponia aquimaris]|uniref:Uncharacterized protein n=1 Tax=Maliponia aquimaris TaxID=1673631 RepID=A0A238L5P5_9RHOB|nr:hypothetical protein [Maliponia aquimaris]SMX50308.1 hypothetical protein MAA8898_04712 [Maliponia aquimaris]